MIATLNVIKKRDKNIFLHKLCAKNTEWEERERETLKIEKKTEKFPTRNGIARKKKPLILRDSYL